MAVKPNGEIVGLVVSAYGGPHGAIAVSVFVALLLAAGVAAVGIAYWFVQAHAPFSARAEPTRLETEVALRLRHCRFPRINAREESACRRPPRTSRRASSISRIIAPCATANNGAGDTPIGRGLYPKPPSCARRARSRSPTARSSRSSRTASASPACRRSAGRRRARRRGLMAARPVHPPSAAENRRKSPRWKS